jgi:D-serine deaminase-like pyridoxal phosphate-dependent protein
MFVVIPPLHIYELEDADAILTPALLIYPEIVDANISATLRMVGNDANRWRPHIKTAKIPAVLRQMIARGVSSFKCSTTLELLTACEAGAGDVLLAFAVMSANARRVVQIAEQFPATRVSVLIENDEQARPWRGTKVGTFIDVNSGMNRTGMSTEHEREIVKLGASLGAGFRGLHFYDGHVAGFGKAEREARTHAGYDKLMELVEQFGAEHLPVGEVITSGTPAAPYAGSYGGFRDAGFIHRISPGTVVYNDLTSLEQLAEYGYGAAVLVLATVVSHPTARSVTCDAGHKSVSVDAGVPNCAVLGWPHLEPLKPSEEHLPIESADSASLPALGSKLYLLPRHVCPTVNNFDLAVMVVNGAVRGTERVSARGHEGPFALAS